MVNLSNLSKFKNVINDYNDDLKRASKSINQTLYLIPFSITVWRRGNSTFFILLLVFRRQRELFQTFIKSECILSKPTMSGTTNGKPETILGILLKFKLAASNREVISAL